jgi:folate-dependent phosphoribosylglycinamide formyltransferase PurN
MKVVVLTGSDSPFLRRAVEALAQLEGIQIQGILLDEARPSPRQRIRNLWRNRKREGNGYMLARLAELLQERLEQGSSSMADPAEVEALMRAAFPEEAFSLTEVAQRYGIPLASVTNLNSAEAIAAFRAFGEVDLGIVLGTRILKRSTFAIPKLGSINLHQGKVPEYRGMPPGFWELFHREPTCGITVHFVDDGLDTGAIVCETEIPIHAKEVPYTLQQRLNQESVPLLLHAVTQLAAGTAQPRPQPAAAGRAHTRPTRRQLVELASRAPHLSVVRPRPFYSLIKTLLYAGMQRLGIISLRRALRSGSRGCILLYHRVDDFSADTLTVSRRRFAEHLCFLRKYYDVQTTAWFVERLKQGLPIPPTTVAIHFDDCYESVASAAARLLQAAKLPGASFISSGFIDTQRQFEHDCGNYPWVYANMSSTQVRELNRYGVEVGSHTVNHVDMGRVATADAHYELNTSRAALEQLLGLPVLWFSFPFGKKHNFRPEYLPLLKDAGYEANFSAYGGFVGSKTDLYDIPRLGVSEMHRPLDLLIDIEGLGMRNLKSS